MEDEERQKKLEAGKAKLAEYRQRKAHADSQKKQKKKKKKKPEEDSQGGAEVEADRSDGRGAFSDGGRHGQREGDPDPPTTEFTFTRTLQSGETVKHDQSYTIEPESEVSTTAEDYSSEVNGCHETTEILMMSAEDAIWEEADPSLQLTKGGEIQDMEDALAAKTQVVEELNRELEEIRAAFGTEGVQQLQDFEAALKQRDGIITQLTANLQQAREEKDEIMKEFLELTEQSQKLHIQFQQLQAGETLRNTSHSSTAADLLQARQQLLHFQQQMDEMNSEAGRTQERSNKQLENIGQLQHKLREMEMSGRRSEESFLQRISTKDLHIAEQDRVIISLEQSLRELKTTEEALAETLREKNVFISEQAAIIAERERSLTLLREQVAHAERTTSDDTSRRSSEKDLIIADRERVISERDLSLARLEDELKASEERLRELQQQAAAKQLELERCLGELQGAAGALESCKSEMESCKLELEKERTELESCKGELATSRQKERMSSGEIMQLMGTVEDLQKRCHQGNLSESDAIQKMQEDTARKLELLRAELDEMYGQQIVQMKHELNLQHKNRAEQIEERHRAELELLRERGSAVSRSEVESLNARIRELQEMSELSRATHDKTATELHRVNQEKTDLQVEVENLRVVLRAAEEKANVMSHGITTQENQRNELQRLREVADALRRQLAAAQETAQEAAAKHDSEMTNYKIKLEMLEREKDAVLDRMAESQEAELERLRTQLLFSHEEELTLLREELQRESFLNAENLLNEAAIRHEKALDELRAAYEDELRSSHGRNSAFAKERDELLHQILGLKEDLTSASQGPKAEELVQQLQQLQLELEELRRGGEERARLENEIQALLRSKEVLENQAKESEQCWENKWKGQELEKEKLAECRNSLRKELDEKISEMATLVAEKGQIQRQLVELREEVEKQRTTFSFAERNFEVNYQELKGEYDCLVEAKAQLEERKLKETLELEAEIVGLKSRIGTPGENSRNTEDTDRRTAAEKDDAKLTEKLDATLREKESLAARLSEVTRRLAFTQSGVAQLEGELARARREDATFDGQNESRRSGPGEEDAQGRACPPEDQIRCLKQEIESLRSLLQAAKAERDDVRRTLELQALSRSGTPEGPPGGRPATHKSSASGSSRRKRRQRSKQERKLGAAASYGRESELREEGEEATAEEERATSVAEQEMQSGMESPVMSHSKETTDKEDSADGYHGDGGGDDTIKQRECRLRLEAQRVSLTQIHAAQLELLQEETAGRAPSLQRHGNQAEPQISRHRGILRAVTEECSEIVQSFRRMFGTEFLEGVDEERRPIPSAEQLETSETTSVVQEARELYRNLQTMQGRIEWEHGRLSDLQSLLRADGNKMIELQTTYDELKSSSEREISHLRLQVAHLSQSGSRDLEERAGAPSTSLSGELQRLRAEAQEKHLRLEESHRQELERLRAHYRQQAAEADERYATELVMLQQRLQELADSQGDHSMTGFPESTSEEHREELKGSSEGDAGPRRPVRSADLTAQLQALREALYHKYVQEVAALREQHSTELRRLREEQERQQGTRTRREEERDLDGSSSEEKQLWPRVEEEVAKAIVQMSVEFAQKVELARIDKQARRASASMQTQSDEEDAEERGSGEATPRASPTRRTWPEERERLGRELEEKEAEIRALKEDLLRTELAVKRTGGGEVTDGDEEDSARLDGTETPAHRWSSQDDEDSFSNYSERDLLRRANEKLSQALVEVLKTTAAAEETMGLHMQSLRDASGAGQQARRTDSTQESASWQPLAPASAGHSSQSFLGSEADTDDLSGWSTEAGADLEVSQQLMDCLLQGAGAQLDNEERLMGIGSRLQTALEKMLMAITDTGDQLEHARMTQTELMRESFRHNQEMNELLQKQEELQDRLSEESRAREQLALELHRAEGLIDGYTGERATLEEQLRQKEELQLNLEQELQVTSNRLHDLEQERHQMQEERELLSRQQDAMRENAGSRELRLVEAAMVAAPEADLLEETEKLMKEKVEVQRQAEKENADLLKQVKLLEAELEEHVGRAIELEHAQTMETGDLRQQIQALEKQLEKNRKFLDEQAVDREHERDFFQQEIHKLEQQLKNPQKVQAGSEQRSQEVEQLTSQLKEKADWCSELLLSAEQLRRELGERDEEIDKLESRIRELEQALLASAESLEKVEQKKQHASVADAKHSTLETQLQTEREALERKEKEICNLEEQLEQFREELENKSEEVQQLHMQLEIQRKEISSQQEYLETRESLLQVMEEKDREIALLNEKLTKVQHMETASDNKEIDEREELIKDLESQVECLRGEQERLKRNNEEESDQLNAVIEKLQQELVSIGQKEAAEEDEDAKAERESEDLGPGREEWMDTVAAELDAYGAEAFSGGEKPEGDLEEALRQKTAGLVVMQAQVQALEQSAASRVEELDLRIQELEALLREKDGEISRCRLLVEQTQSNADQLRRRVSGLEDNLREKVAAALVSKATLEAFQQQSQTSGGGPDPQNQGDSGSPRDGQTAQVGQTKGNGHVTERLLELEADLSGIQEDQELQSRLLLHGSQEEVLDYERRLVALMDLLGEMKAKIQQRISPDREASKGVDQQTTSQLLQELQEVREEASATKEQLDHYVVRCGGLQEDLKEKMETIERLQDQLHSISSAGDEKKLSELRLELLEAQNEAAATKEQLSSSKESLEKLQELLQEREMTIAQLKAELFQVKAESDTELARELQEAQRHADSTKEELRSFRRRSEELQEDIQAREATICELREELREVTENVDTAKEELRSYVQNNEKLREEVQARDLALSKLKEELQDVRSASSSPSPSPQPLSSSSSSANAQPKRKGGKQPGSKGSNDKDKQSLSRRNSSASGQSSARSHAARTGGGSEPQRPTVTDSSIQTDPVQAPGRRSPPGATKEEVEEVIGEFQEKIAQMQELHAAEILDMEARHISESDALRRETQALMDECKTLKAVIDKLRSAEGPHPRPDRSQFKDGYTSDSSSDYSQRTGYDLPSLQQEFRTTPEGARREADDPLPDRIKTLLREVHQEGMQVLSLSELPFPEGETGGQPGVQGWAKERDTLLGTVESLKSLIAQMQTHRGAQTPGVDDWRAQLLEAVRQVFVRERSVLKSALYSQLDLLDTSDAVIHLNQLERRLAEQDAQHSEAMGSLRAADRSSLLSEIHQLRAQLEQLHEGARPAATSAAERSAKERREAGEADAAGETGAMLLEELKAELSQTKLELEATLKAQHKHLKELDALRAEVSQKAAETDALSDQLLEERKRSRDLQWAAEKERCRTGRNEESKREEMEDLELTLEEQRGRVAELTATVEQERRASSQLCQQAEHEHLRLHRHLQELQVQLETERAKAREVEAALERERELRAGAAADGARRRAPGDTDGLTEEGNLLERLQRDLDDKHAQVVQLLGRVEAHKLEEVQKEEELALCSQRSRRDQEALLEARAQLENARAQVSEAEGRLERELERRRSLEEEKQRLEEALAQLESPGGGTRPPRTDARAEDDDGRRESPDRTEGGSLQQREGRPADAHRGPWRTLDKILSELHLVSSKIRSVASRTAGGAPAEVTGEELSEIQSSLEEVVTMLQQSPGLPSVLQSVPPPAGVPGSSSSSSSPLTERLLRQNAELTGFVSRLTEEKNDLRNQTLHLEEELRRYRHAGRASGDSPVGRRFPSRSDPSDTLLSQERESWARERVRLEKAFQLAQAQVARLKGEIRTEALRDMTGPEADNAALKRMYGKYLRAEGFRKALIYQKKYLLLLLGGFQECEEATLSLLARMGGRPSPSTLESLNQRRRGLMRFRSAVRVSIALSRMRFLVKRWHKATGSGSGASCGANKTRAGQTATGTDGRDSHYLHPGGVDVYRGPGGVSGSQGRSGRESPRSAVSSTHHKFHLAADPGHLTCSHLQSYDPDRALTDYISRLEALQRRLGSVTSGASSSYAQLHFGLRR